MVSGAENLVLRGFEQGSSPGSRQLGGGGGKGLCPQPGSLPTRPFDQSELLFLVEEDVLDEIYIPLLGKEQGAGTNKEGRSEGWWCEKGVMEEGARGDGGRSEG